MKNPKHMLKQMECQDIRHNYSLRQTWIFASPTWHLRGHSSDHSGPNSGCIS